MAQAIDAMAEDLENAMKGGKSVEDAVTDVVKASYGDNRQIVFDGDGYSDEWQEEAARRGLLNLRTTPDALPWIVNEQTVTVFSTTTCSPSASWRPGTRSSPSSTR